MIALPASIGIALDRSVRRYREDTVLVGGAPPHALRLTTTGRAAVDALLAGRDPGDAGRRLARRLVEAGLAHPRPRPIAASPSITVVVPTRDRPHELARCLAALGGGAPVVVVDDGSRDHGAVAEACRRPGARLIRRDRSGGPAAARNTALAEISTELVAFLDSDCVPMAGWLHPVVAHFADPLVGAVAPRVRPAPLSGRPRILDRYLATRSPLDMGDREARVIPGRRVSYVPTAALVVRRSALERAFDPELRFGEDVDLVWRLHDAGWHIRYEPGATVHHSEPRSWAALLRRRWRYGTSAGPLAQRHPNRLAPLVARPLPIAAGLLTLARRPLAASAVVGLDAAVLARRTRRAGVPGHVAIAWASRATALTLVGAGRTATSLSSPFVAAALRHRRRRPTALALLVAAPLHEWATRRPALDPARWTLACIADDVAYGLGVWQGSLRHRTARPLLPTLHTPR